MEADSFGSFPLDFNVWDIANRKKINKKKKNELTKRTTDEESWLILMCLITKNDGTSGLDNCPSHGKMHRPKKKKIDSMIEAKKSSKKKHTRKNAQCAADNGNF